MTPALKPATSVNFDKARRDRAERGARGANKRWSAREPWSAYVMPAKKSSRWLIRWRRRGGKYHQGSVDTQAEAEALVAVVRASLRAGMTPPKLPTGRAAQGRAPDPEAAVLAARREVMRRVMARAERCDACGLLKPCDPCFGEMRAELRAARRGE